MTEQTQLTLSPLGHTWILDLDGTLVKHNGYKIDGYDTFLSGAKDFLSSIPKDDMVIIVTSRMLDYRELTERFLTENVVRYDHIIYNAPYGERIIFNDRKVSGLATSIAINATRDGVVSVKLNIDQTL